VYKVTKSSYSSSLVETAINGGYFHGMVSLNFTLMLLDSTMVHDPRADEISTRYALIPLMWIAGRMQQLTCLQLLADQLLKESHGHSKRR
jgi:hypothetical protein